MWRAVETMLSSLAGLGDARDIVVIVDDGVPEDTVTPYSPSRMAGGVHAVLRGQTPGRRRRGFRRADVAVHHASASPTISCSWAASAWLMQFLGQRRAVRLASFSSSSLSSHGPSATGCGKPPFCCWRAFPRFADLLLS
jgi:hypothetical protein